MKGKVHGRSNMFVKQNRIASEWNCYGGHNAFVSYACSGVWWEKSSMDATFSGCFDVISIYFIIFAPELKHFLNNTFSSILTIAAGTDNLVDILGGQTIVYALFALTSIGSLSLFVKYWKS